MKGWSAIVAGLASLVVLGWTLVPVDAQSGKTPTIKEIMTKLNKGKGALCATLGTELKPETPEWNSIQKQTVVFAEFAAALRKNNPPKGSKTSWDALTRQYAADARSLDDAAKKKDRAAALVAHGKVSKSCKACHDAHRG